MTLFEPITANITIAIEALEQLHIDWHAIQKAIYEAGIKFAQFVTLKANSEFEISTQEPWVIRRKEDGFIPKFSKNNSGYLQVRIGEQMYLLHRLVDEQFVTNDDPITKTQIDHKNGVKTDNRIENLRWVSNSENCKNKMKHNADVIYEYVDELPDDAIIINDYGLHQVLHINERKQNETETYPITLKSRAESSFINQQLKYDFVYQLPDDAFRIETYDSGRGYYDVQKITGAQVVYLSDSNERRVVQLKAVQSIGLNSRNCQLCGQISQLMTKKSIKITKDDLYQEIAQKQFPFKSKYDVIRKANYYDIPTHQTKNQFDIYPQTNTLELHDYQLKPLAKFERPYFSPNYNSWEIDQVFIMKKNVEIKQYLFAINTTIEINNEVQSEQVEQLIEKRSVGRPKKYFNDDDRKEAIRKQQLATKRRYAQKKAQIYSRNNTVQKQLMKLLSDHNFKEYDMDFQLEYLETDIEQKIIPKAIQ
ncbi:MAG: hypothetical protein EZS28_008350 [Streblomastix strix]|uniref:HNH nuclease domain-containing protein n=1 Tax=Streblomastix strix TaxID=222440 RepID=A0A5J4WPJ5_9EUKA|nr:MAG: hypothetical protein EZS28_008350 [Streblomastix strix]